VIIVETLPPGNDIAIEKSLKQKDFTVSESARGFVQLTVVFQDVREEA
jgi:hypothetical protein